MNEYALIYTTVTMFDWRSAVEDLDLVMRDVSVTISVTISVIG